MGVQEQNDEFISNSHSSMCLPPYLPPCLPPMSIMSATVPTSKCLSLICMKICTQNVDSASRVISKTLENSLDLCTK